MSIPPSLPESSRAEARKAQVLEAASECFRHNGFHGTSMAQISKAAGMSVGHIYHYFENKEAIIAAIVERDLLNLMTITDRIRRSGHGGDVLKAMVEDVDASVADTTNDANAALMLEIVAEAARNPAVAAIIHKADGLAMEHMRAFINEGLAAYGVTRTDQEIDGPLSVLAALFEGLTIRLIRNPELDVSSYLPALRGTVAYVIESQILRKPLAA